MTKRRVGLLLITFILTLSLMLTGCELLFGNDTPPLLSDVPENVVINGERIPAYSGEPYYVVNGNTPFFKDSEITDIGFYEYSDLDTLGRAGAAWGSVGPDTLPSDKREDINHIYPSGWKYNGKSNNNKYDASTGVNTYIYNRAHLLANQLVSDDVDERNFFTGTCDMNQKHMVKFENMVADYVKEDGGHVMYRVTPYFEGQNLICSGVLMEGYSVEDEGESVMFCVFIYNVQPNIFINYLTGENCLTEDAGEITPPADCKHTETELRNKVDASCGTDGYSGDLWCLECDTKIATGDTVAKTGEHSYSEWSLTEGTNTEKRTCDICGAEESRKFEIEYKEGTAYVLTGEHEVTRYFSGSFTSGSKGGLNTTENKAEAIDVYLESSGNENAYYVYFLDGSTKRYITATGSATTSLSITEEKTTAWVINEDGHITSGGRTLGCYSGEYFRYYASVSDSGQYRPLCLIENE